MNNEIKDSGDRTQFESGAVRDMHEGKGRFDLLPMCVLMRLAKHYEAGSKKYGDRNWEKGIPCHSYADSAMRHFVKYMDGWNDEDHLIAAIWNLCCLAWTEEKRPDLMDIPARLFKLEQKKDLDLNIIPAKVKESSEVMNYCASCKYKGYGIDFEPCFSCSDYSNYEKCEEETNDKNENL